MCAWTQSDTGDAQAMEYFDVDLQTELIVDVSPIGLIEILTRREADGREWIIEYASRGLTEAEKNYSQSEREMLIHCALHPRIRLNPSCHYDIVAVQYLGYLIKYCIEIIIIWGCHFTC